MRSMVEGSEPAFPEGPEFWMGPPSSCRPLHQPPAGPPPRYAERKIISPATAARAFARTPSGLP